MSQVFTEARLSGTINTCVAAMMTRQPELGSQAGLIWKLYLELLRRAAVVSWLDWTTGAQRQGNSFDQVIIVQGP